MEVESTRKLWLAVVQMGLTEEIGPWEWEAGEKEGNPPGWAATKQALKV
jgi:hypothetical protein